MSPMRMNPLVWSIAIMMVLCSSILAHPASGIVVDAQGNVFVADIKTAV